MFLSFVFILPCLTRLNLARPDPGEPLRTMPYHYPALPDHNPQNHGLPQSGKTNRTKPEPTITHLSVTERNRLDRTTPNPDQTTDHPAGTRPAMPYRVIPKPTIPHTTRSDQNPFGLSKPDQDRPHHDP